MTNISLFSCLPIRNNRHEQQPEGYRFRHLQLSTRNEHNQATSNLFQSGPEQYFNPDLFDAPPNQPGLQVNNRKNFGRVKLMTRLGRIKNRLVARFRSNDPEKYFNPHLFSPLNASAWSPRHIFSSNRDSQASRLNASNFSIYSAFTDAESPVGIGDGADFFEPGLFVSENRFTWPMGELRQKSDAARIKLSPIAENPMAVHVSILENSPAFQVALDDFLANPKASAKTVEMLLAHAANPNQVTSRNTPVLTAAIRANHPRAFKLFLKHPRININKPDLLGFTPLSTAVICNNEFAFKKLMEKGAEIMRKDSTGRTALDWAALMGRPDMLKDLLKSPQVKHLSDDPAYLSQLTPQMKQDLIHRVKHQQADISENKALDDDEKKRMALNAIQFDDLNQLMGCLASGLDVNASGLNFHSVDSLFGCAALLERVEIATALVAAGAGPDWATTRNGHISGERGSLLNNLIQRGNLKMTQLLLNAGADPTLKDTDGRNALHYAAANNAHELVQPLLQAGCRVDEVDHRGNTALTSSHGPHSEDTVLALLKAGANPTKAGPIFTPLGRSILSGHTTAVKALLDAGADPNQGGLISLPIMLARKPEVVQMLLDAGAEVNRPDEHGKTALMNAVEEYKPDLMETLLKGGAQVKVGRHSAMDLLREPELSDISPFLEFPPENVQLLRQAFQETYDQEKINYKQMVPSLKSATRKQNPHPGNDLVQATNYFRPTLFRNLDNERTGKLEDYFNPQLFNEPKLPMHRKLWARLRSPLKAKQSQPS